MPHQVQQDNTQKIFQNTRRGLVLPTVAIFIISVIILFGLTVFSVRSLDNVSEEKSVHLAKSVLADIEQKLMAQNFDYAFWDQAVDNLVYAYDPAWADVNIGHYLYETFGVDVSYVINDIGEITYVSMEGEHVADMPGSNFMSGNKPLIARAKSETARDEVPVPISGFVLDNDQLYFASATRLTTYQTVGGEDINEATDSVLVLMKALNDEQLANLADRYLLQDLRVELSADAEVSSTSLPIINVEGVPIGAFHWRTDLPGTELLRWLLPAVIILFLMMGTLIFLSIRRATNASHAFIAALTGRHEAELERQLGQVQKMQALGIMVGGVAHNFNNLLQPILMLSLNMRKRTAENSRDRADFNVIIQACEQAANLVKQISNFTREKETANGSGQNIYEVVDQGCKLVASTIPTSITLTTNLDEETGTVLADPIETQTVLMNLISNAIDAMDRQVGELTITLSRVFVDGDDASQALQIESGKYAKLTVRDTGVGMDQETMKRVFDPFFTTKDVGRGTGLGLSSAYGIVTRHGGAMNVSSTLGEGSTFEVFLPLLDDDDREASRI